MTEEAENLIKRLQKRQQTIAKLDKEKLLVQTTEAIKAIIVGIETIEALNVRCQQRGERMKIMRDAFREIDWDHACRENPVLLNFFDENGEPT